MRVLLVLLAVVACAEPSSRAPERVYREMLLPEPVVVNGVRCSALGCTNMLSDGGTICVLAACSYAQDGGP
jgi:hypothetical protein